MSGVRKLPVKYSAETYKKYIHTKYDYILSKIKKLPNAELDNTFYEGLKECVKQKSDLPFFRTFYDYYFSKYNIDSLIDIAYSLPAKERRMCRDLIISSVLCYMDHPKVKKSLSNITERTIELSDIYFEIRINKNLWYGDDANIRIYLKKHYANRILNATYPQTGYMTSKRQEKKLKKVYIDYDFYSDKKRFLRLVQEVFAQLSQNISYEESEEKALQDMDDFVIEDTLQQNESIPNQNEIMKKTSEGNVSEFAKTSSSQANTSSMLIHDTTNIYALDSVDYELAEEVELSINSTDNESETKRNKKTVRPKGDIDYAEQQTISQKIGDAGEKIVLQNEIDKLTKLGLPEELISKVRRVSLESDDYGFDILSFDEYGNERYLEVKTTKVSRQDFSFILTQNEFEHAKELGRQYCIVIVFDILSHPRIWYMGNPFIEEPYKVRIKPIQYRVDVNVE